MSYCLATLIYVLVPTKADSIIKECSCNWGIVGASGAGSIKILLVLFGGLRVWDNWLQPAFLGVGVLWTEFPNSFKS